MFLNCRRFNQSLNDWNVNITTNIQHMFVGAVSMRRNNMIGIIRPPELVQRTRS
jgi:hypothetical protein